MAKYLTCAQVAEILNTSERFVRRLVEERRIEFYHFGRHVRISDVALEAYIQASRVEPITLDCGIERMAA